MQESIKQINDAMGHSIGSRLLVETAEFLRSSFRETDVLARIGGDEFAVAGQFSHAAIEHARARLAGQAALLNNENGQSVRLSLSMGHATTDPRKTESLKDLLDRADAAMYQQKRMKKLQVI